MTDNVILNRTRLRYFEANNFKKYKISLDNNWVELVLNHDFSDDIMGKIEVPYMDVTRKSTVVPKWLTFCYEDVVMILVPKSVYESTLSGEETYFPAISEQVITP